MLKRRHTYTYREAQTVLREWLRKHGMLESPTKFQMWLDLRGVVVSRQYCSLLTTGNLTPGPKFKQVFKQVTGIALVDGLIEDEKASQ